MPDDGRLRRTLLFVPGDDLKKIARAAASRADSVILDLEDGVGISSKAAARSVVVQALTSGSFDFGHSERIVRINPAATGLQEDDLLAALQAQPDAIMLPKVEDAAEVQAVADRLSRYESAHNLDPGAIRLLALVETARGLINLPAIAAADPRLVALVFGADDLAASLGATRSPGDPELAAARGLFVLHAAAAALQPLDTPWVAIHDLDGLRADTLAAMRLGFQGRTLIHPSHIAPVAEVFTPPADAVERARRLVEAHREHQAQGRGAFAFEGRMVDMPVIRAAERVLARARAARGE